MGAVATFIGCVRDLNEGTNVSRMTLEHYPGMTERALEEICDEAMRRWDLIDLRVVHRVGPLEPGECHRAGGRLERASRRGLRGVRVRDGLPEDPRTLLEEGGDAEGSRWVEARSSDDEAAARWMPGTGPRASRTPRASSRSS